MSKLLISKFSSNKVYENIADVEKKYNIVFPKQYREFLCKYNGGDTPKTKFKIGKISSDIRGFYGMGNVKLSFDTIELPMWIEENVLPIACDSFGNYIVIGVGDENNGKIFFCDHEKGNKKEYIAEDLKIFIQYCKSGEIDPASRLSIKEREEALIARGRGHVITEDLRQMWQAEIDKYKNMVREEVVIGGEENA